LNAAKDFIKTNNKIRWAKTADSRIEKPDYAERAYFEILVNAILCKCLHKTAYVKPVVM
ncbi:MAG: AAA family ATPase, partial [Clostridiaceae bacterium]|nr:AAA family ATPase [Clostridiaceae bacterium]